VVSGIAFERTGVHPIHENTRAYSISTSYEKPMSIVAPCKNMKYYGEITDRLHLCSDMVFVSFSTIMTCCVVVVLMCYAKVLMELMSETLNFLPPGVTEPIKMQVNVSPAKAFGEGMYTVTFTRACLIILIQRNI